MPSGRRWSGSWDVLVCGATLRRPGRRAGAARDRRARARHRPLRGRRAADVRVRGADRVARRTSASRARSARRSATSSSTPRARRPLAAAVDVLDVRLPRAVRAAATPRATPPSRRRRSTGTRRATPSTPTAATSPRRSSSTRSAGGACCRTPPSRSSRPRRGSRAAWRSTPPASGRRPRAVARPDVRARRLRVELPGRRRAARRRRLVRPARPRQGADGRASPATFGVPAERYQGNWIPHQMRDGGRGRRLLRRRLAPATACRRRPRASARRSTSAWPAGASCARSSRAASRASRRWPATRPSARSAAARFDWLLRVQSLVSRVNPTPRWRRSSGRWTAGASCAGPSTTTSPSRRPSFALEGGLAAPRGEHEALAQAS